MGIGWPVIERRRPEFLKERKKREVGTTCMREQRLSAATFGGETRYLGPGYRCNVTKLPFSSATRCHIQHSGDGERFPTSQRV